MAQPTGNSALIQGIQQAESAGRAITDTEAAALAAGALEPSDLLAPPLTNGRPQGPKGGSKETSPEEKKVLEEESKKESDEESSDDDEEGKKERNTPGISVAEISSIKTEETPALLGGEGMGEEGSPAGTALENGKEKEGADPMDVVEDDGHGELGVGKFDGVVSKGKRKARAAPADVQPERVAPPTAPQDGGEGVCIEVAENEGGKEGMVVEDMLESGEDSSSESDGPEPPRRNKNPVLPRTGPLSFCPDGDISDGDDGDFMGSAVPMTKNEGIEPILPLGEVSMDGAEVMEVGKILALVEADGTVVIQGTPGKPPLDEGSVLSAATEKAEDGGGGETKEPIGRIHEIFGPCVIPHYTVRVEGAATQHQMVLRYQTAKKNLLNAEKEQAQALKKINKAESEKEAAAAAAVAAAAAAETTAGENNLNGESTEAENQGNVAPTATTAPASTSTAGAPSETVAGEGEGVATSPVTVEVMPVPAGIETVVARVGKQQPVAAPLIIAAQNRAAAQKAKHDRRKPSPNIPEKLEALKELVKEAEEAMAGRVEHPFHRWKLGAPVYALKNHAKFLAKELLVPSGKGTDASNCHDEEACEEEFSDDEKEQLAKTRNKKNKRRESMTMQGILPHEIDEIFAEEEEKKRLLSAKREAGNANAASKRGGRGGRGRGGRGNSSDRGGGRGGGRGSSRGDRGAQTDGRLPPGSTANGSSASPRSAGYSPNGGVVIPQQQQRPGQAQQSSSLPFAPTAVVPPRFGPGPGATVMQGPGLVSGGYGGPLPPPPPPPPQFFPVHQQQIPNPSQYVQQHHQHQHPQQQYHGQPPAQQYYQQGSPAVLYQQPYQHQQGGLAPQYGAQRVLPQQSNAVNSTGVVYGQPPAGTQTPRNFPFTPPSANGSNYPPR